MDSCATGGQGCVWYNQCQCYAPPDGSGYKNPPSTQDTHKGGSGGNRGGHTSTSSHPVKSSVAQSDQNRYCFLNPDAQSCAPSSHKFATIVNQQIIVAPSQNDLDAEVRKVFPCKEKQSTCADAINSDYSGSSVANQICADHRDWCILQDISSVTLTSGAGILG